MRSEGYALSRVTEGYGVIWLEVIHTHEVRGSSPLAPTM